MLARPNQIPGGNLRQAAEDSRRSRMKQKLGTTVHVIRHIKDRTTQLQEGSSDLWWIVPGDERHFSIIICK